MFKASAANVYIAKDYSTQTAILAICFSIKINVQVSQAETS